MTALVSFKTELFGRGYQHILDNVDKTQNIIYYSIYDSLIDASLIVKNRAIQNVNAWAKEPGLSQVGGSITEEANWIVHKENDLTATLRCISKHAAVVELGGEETGSTLVVMTKGNGYPIGLQQGKEPIIRKSFLIQQPMAYLRSAKDSPDIQSQMRYNIKRNLWSAIKRNL